MSKTLDLSKKMDFAKATGSAFAQVLALFGRDPEKWELQECSYNFVPMLVLWGKVEWQTAVPQIKDTGGRRLAMLQYPYVDGQTTDDLGRAPESFDVECIFFGDGYKYGMKKLFAEMQDPEPGYFEHPVRGITKCKMKSYTLTHEHQSRKAVLMSITFVEHNFTIASYGKLYINKNFKSLLNDLMAAFNVFQNLINTVQGLVNAYNDIKNFITNLVDAFRSAFLDTVVDLNSVFNTNLSLDIPMLLPTTQGGVLRPDGRLTTSTGQVTVLPNGTLAPGSTLGVAGENASSIAADDPFASIPVSQIQAAITAAQSAFATGAGQSTNSANSTAGGIGVSQSQTASGASSFATGSAQAAGISTYGMSLEQIGNLANSVAAIIVQNKINSVRTLADNLIKYLSALKFGSPAFEPLGTDSDGALQFQAEILDLKRVCILLQQAYEAGAAKTRIGIKTYVVPRLMSLREVAFVNGLSVEDVAQLDILNPELESTNYLPRDTEVVVPI